MALTITPSAVDVWVLTAQNAVRPGAAIDISGSFQSVIHTDIALGDTAAHTGTRCVLQVSSAADDDEFWTDYLEFVAAVGTANTEIVLNNPLNATETQIEVADLTGFTVATGGVLKAFMLDNTVANSELIEIVSTSVEGGNDLINILDGVKREHVITTTVLSNIAESRQIVIPTGYLRARMIYDNLYDADGATIYTRTRVVKTTSVT